MTDWKHDGRRGDWYTDCSCGGLVTYDPASERFICSRDCEVPEDLAERHMPPEIDSSPIGVALEERNGTLPFRHASEVLRSVPEEVQWLLRNYLALGAITLLGGKPKAGKSTFVVELLKRLLRGEPFLELPTDRSGVLFLTEERHSTLRSKIERHRLDAGRCHVLSLHEASGLAWSAVVRQAVAYCSEHELRLLVVDTLDKWARFRGDDEQKSGAVNEAMEPLIAAAGSGLAVLVVAHQRKAEGKYGEAVRGSNALAGSVDLIVELERPGDDLGKSIRSLKASGRFEETADELYVDLTDDGYRVVGDVQEARHESELQAILTALDELGPSTVEEVAEETDLKSTTVRRRLEEAHERDEVRKTGEGKRGDPFRYALPGIDSSSPPPIAEERNPGEAGEVVALGASSPDPPQVVMRFDAARFDEHDELVDVAEAFDAVVLDEVPAAEVDWDFREPVR